MIGVRIGAWGGVALALWLAVPPATRAPPRCREAPAAEALCRLAVWGREWAKAKGPVAARSARRVAWVADRGGTVLEALFLVTLQEAAPARPGASANRPQWVRCTWPEADPWR